MPAWDERLRIPPLLQSRHLHEPLQFQKRLRLQEIRRLMPGEGLDAASAAYHSAWHFNRENKSLFGLSPMRDVEWLREPARENISLTADQEISYCILHSHTYITSNTH